MTRTSSETRAEVRLSGRELARQRRQAMAVLGKRAVRPAGRTTTPAMAAAAVSRPASPERMPVAGAVSTGASGRLLARQRREALSRAGKAALPGAQSAAQRPVRGVRRAAVQSAAETGRQAAACRCGCKENDAGAARSAPAAAVRPASEALTPKDLAARRARHMAGSSGREIALARRKALAREGKAGLKRAMQATKIAKYLPDQDWRVAIDKGVTGRQIAMQRRKVQSLTGRGEIEDAAASRRPSGRRSARALRAPSKVEEGHTLAGQEVTGTMVERAPRVTGNEHGTCRNVTGTEYVGAEQFETFCQSRPEPHTPKITLSHTLSGRTVTGTSVEPDEDVTGAEYGLCREITGTQYLSADHFQSVCHTRPKPPVGKVAVDTTERGEKLTGPRVVGETRVTGQEAGGERAITGTGYGRLKTPRPAPEKVAVTHTADGLVVTGTAVGHSPRITGDEPGLCRAVTGTEYLSAEQYTELCHTQPPRPPRKISVMSSPRGKAVSGTAVGRDRHVTGDEYGACRPITGTPYFNSQDFGDLCVVPAPRKVGEEHTRAGTPVSGTEVVSNPKMTGDEEGRCALVTGTDYVGAQDLAPVCAESTPEDRPVAKVAVDATWTGGPVTGSAVGRSPRVTGDEEGACAPVSGTPYIGRAQYQQFCPAPSAEAQEARVPSRGVVSAAEVTGDRPGVGGPVVTGDERGACEPVTGTPYVGLDNLPASCDIGSAGSHRFLAGVEPSYTPSRPEPPRDFSIMSPARWAWERRRSSTVTGASLASSRITGSASRAEGLVTGTPEFRHREIGAAAAEAEARQEALRQRLSGEAATRGARITGDAWSGQPRVTGTEGRFSVRNPTQRGEPRGEGRNARSFAQIERPEVPDTPITGSAGATERGAVVTVSGGARG